jgi:hypothetical protein
MAKVWIICAMVALAAGSALSVTADEQAGVAGEWRGTYTGTQRGGRLTFYLTLKQDGEQVTGTASNPSTNPPVPERPVSGTIKDGVLVFQKGWKGFKGVVNGNSMSGTFPFDQREVDFTATRTK